MNQNALGSCRTKQADVDRQFLLVRSSRTQLQHVQATIMRSYSFAEPAPSRYEVWREIWSDASRGLIQAQALAVKANSLRGLLRRFHQLTDRFEQDNDLLIMSFYSLLQFSQFSREFFVRS